VAAPQLAPLAHVGMSYAPVSSQGGLATSMARFRGCSPTPSRLAATFLAVLVVVALGFLPPPHPQLDNPLNCGAAATPHTKSHLHSQRTPCFNSTRRGDMEKMVRLACQRSVPKAPIRHAGPLFVGVIDEKSYKTDPNLKYLAAHLGEHLVPMVLPRWEGHGVGMYAVLQLVKALKYEAVLTRTPRGLRTVNGLPASSCCAYRRHRAACPREGGAVRTPHAYQPRAYRVPWHPRYEGVVIKIDVMDAYPIKTLAEIVASPLPPGNVFLGTERNARITDHLRRAG
jgi:hypothetical protein